MLNGFSIDVEEWFHILDDPGVPHIEAWDTLQSRVEPNVRQLLQTLDNAHVKATFFWLGWVAERHKRLLRECQNSGHEIASHGYHHVLPHVVGAELFREDLERAKKTLEDITGEQVLGFRVAGFGVTRRTQWAFDVIKAVGYEYDSSVFPAQHEHNSMFSTASGPHVIQTAAGPLREVPLLAASFLGLRLFFFGGGYLRLSPKPLIRWGIGRLHRKGLPFVVYVHPREVDPQQPRLHLGPIRCFRSYVNLASTAPKLQWLLKNHEFCPLRDLAGCATSCLDGSHRECADLVNRT